MDQPRATCTGLSIILVDACRTVGVPARSVGVPEWANPKGNHTWVEIWDHGWHFMGADEYDKSSLDHAWFVHHAVLTARSPNPLYHIYAESWTGLAIISRWRGTLIPISCGGECFHPLRRSENEYQRGNHFAKTGTIRRRDDP